MHQCKKHFFLLGTVAVFWSPPLLRIQFVFALNSLGIVSSVGYFCHFVHFAIYLSHISLVSLYNICIIIYTSS